MPTPGRAAESRAALPAAGGAQGGLEAFAGGEERKLAAKVKKCRHSVSCRGALKVVFIRNLWSGTAVASILLQDLLQLCDC